MIEWLSVIEMIENDLQMRQDLRGGNLLLRFFVDLRSKRGGTDALAARITRLAQRRSRPTDPGGGQKYDFGGTRPKGGCEKGPGAIKYILTLFILKQESSWQRRRQRHGCGFKPMVLGVTSVSRPVAPLSCTTIFAETESTPPRLNRLLLASTTSSWRKTSMLSVSKPFLTNGFNYLNTFPGAMSMANFNRPRDNYRRRLKRRRKEARRLSDRCIAASVAMEKKEAPATKTMGREE
jgi:hypothetical protein